MWNICANTLLITFLYIEVANKILLGIYIMHCMFLPIVGYVQNSDRCAVISWLGLYVFIIVLKNNNASLACSACMWWAIVFYIKIHTYSFNTHVVFLSAISYQIFFIYTSYRFKTSITLRMPFKCEQTNTCDNSKTLFYSKIWNKSRNENSMHAKLGWNVLEDVLVNTNMHHNNGEIWQIWAQVGGKGYILGYVCLTCQFDIPWIFLFLKNQSLFSLELKG